VAVSKAKSMDILPEVVCRFRSHPLASGDQAEEKCEHRKAEEER
jgi:hypothetical protein